VAFSAVAQVATVLKCLLFLEPKGPLEILLAGMSRL
jgi:hypothetical protein